MSFGVTGFCATVSAAALIASSTEPDDAILFSPSFVRSSLIFAARDADKLTAPAPPTTPPINPPIAAPLAASAITPSMIS